MGEDREQLSIQLYRWYRSSDNLILVNNMRNLTCKYFYDIIHIFYILVLLLKIIKCDGLDSEE